MKRSILWGFVVAVLSVGCGGLADDAKLSSLSDDEIDTLCEDSTTESKDCGGGVTVTSNNSAECAAAVKSLKDDCVATVSDYNQCDSADLCEKTSDASCMKLIGCAP
jgi:hypothetical protein